MAYDSAKKTSKIEGKKLQTPVQATNEAGIPVDIAEKDAQVRKLHEMFNNSTDVKKFRDIIMAMMHSQSSKHGSEIEIEDHNTFGRRLKTRNLDLAVVAGENQLTEYRQVPDTTNNLTVLNLTDNDYMGVTDRYLLHSSGRMEKALSIEKRYSSPIDEQDSEDRKSDNENVTSASAKENVSTIERDVHDNNRSQIHGLPDIHQV
jgi:hypothetical protein